MIDFPLCMQGGLFFFFFLNHTKIAPKISWYSTNKAYIHKSEILKRLYEQTIREYKFWDISSETKGITRMRGSLGQRGEYFPWEKWGIGIENPRYGQAGDGKVHRGKGLREGIF